MEKLHDCDAKAGAALPVIVLTNSEGTQLCQELQMRPNLYRLVSPIRIDVLIATADEARGARQRAA
jgi:hypothetical protein